MTVNLEWDVEHTIVSPEGSVTLNEVAQILSDGMTRALYLLRPSPYQIIPTALRQVTDNLSQADGTSLQPPYITGLVASLNLEYWTCPNGIREEAELACGTFLREMDEYLTLNLNALRSQGATPDGTQRLLWTPSGTGGARRMITQVLLAGWPTPEWLGADGIGAGVTFALGTPFPYALDEDAVNIDIADGGTEFVPNDGNAEYSPVINVAGATAEFAITRVDTGQVVSYIGPDTIPGGQHAEIDFFTANIAEEGNDLIADLDPTVTEFFTIPPGGCEISSSGADITVISRAAWL